MEWIVIFILFLTNIIKKKKEKRKKNLMESYLLIYHSFLLTHMWTVALKTKNLNSNNSKTKHEESFFLIFQLLFFSFI